MGPCHGLWRTKCLEVNTLTVGARLASSVLPLHSQHFESLLPSICSTSSAPLKMMYIGPLLHSSSTAAPMRFHLPYRLKRVGYLISNSLSDWLLADAFDDEAGRPIMDTYREKHAARPVPEALAKDRDRRLLQAPISAEVRHRSIAIRRVRHPPPASSPSQIATSSRPQRRSQVSTYYGYTYLHSPVPLRSSDFLFTPHLPPRFQCRFPWIASPSRARS